MGIWELLLIAVGLSMDAFAVSVCKGLCMQRFMPRRAAVIALFFGGFQALMPFLGWVLGQQFSRYISQWDHWIAFGLLTFIGGKMLWEALHDKEVICQNKYAPLDLKELFLLAIATSLDALAVGVTFSFLHSSIVPSVTLIGCVTFALSWLGVFVGHRFGAFFRKKAEIAGGVILIVIGVRILLSHLGIL
ncbi:manganese efflux pump MntP family protein [Ethanoligenens harbinense]|uniref:Putative manganese efflux pump MntP n=1 Tax=Ethanoligenens harbinense (strain DSM 18485 / JCM 12961 / CGMCC 1.5033 / YUAN-3) TaxID=663278 RepID=E6U326_ETHHY|nr:manganese efflux pump MntP family protein [Ethanoligenens harbinense]ADU26393.1 protein of unknown function DUF204 [Ethanoligenens harbinense YUAN-3]AVQ95518.1 manganese efflux pump [Ethanoligenens harbinense YUAN-3]AYF38182.1 manganese efflux pump [Ethanoligenens harbinense]AYF40927.1 manganese efflux pump [Ethanoligenens harbinense]QCN91759.1 manganese efflux pump [Ethanoligenens harbinense]